MKVFQVLAVLTVAVGQYEPALHGNYPLPFSINDTKHFLSIKEPRGRAQRQMLYLCGTGNGSIEVCLNLTLNDLRLIMRLMTKK